jgi:hypothetical protein
MDLRKSAGVFVVPELFSVPLIFVYNLNPKKASRNNEKENYENEVIIWYRRKKTKLEEEIVPGSGKQKIEKGKRRNKQEGFRLELEH